MHPRNSSLKVLGEIIQDADTKMEILQDIGIPFDSERMSLLVGVCDNMSILVSLFSDFWGENHAFYWLYLLILQVSPLIPFPDLSSRIRQSVRAPKNPRNPKNPNVDAPPSVPSTVYLAPSPMNSYCVQPIEGLEESYTKIKCAVFKVYALLGCEDEEENAWNTLTKEERAFVVTPTCTYIDKTRRGKHAVVILAEPSTKYSPSPISSPLTLDLPRTDQIRSRLSAHLAFRETITQNHRPTVVLHLSDQLEIILLSDILLLIKLEETPQPETSRRKSVTRHEDSPVVPPKLIRTLLCEPIPKNTCDIGLFSFRAVFENVGDGVCEMSGGVCRIQVTQLQQKERSPSMTNDSLNDSQPTTMYEFHENGTVKELSLPPTPTPPPLLELPTCIPHRWSSSTKTWLPMAPSILRIRTRLPHSTLEITMRGTEKTLFAAYIPPFSDFSIEQQTDKPAVLGDGEITFQGKTRWVLRIVSTFFVVPPRYESNVPELNKGLECVKIECAGREEAEQALRILISERRLSLRQIDPSALLITPIPYLTTTSPEDVFDGLCPVTTFPFDYGWTTTAGRKTPLGPVVVLVTGETLIGFSGHAMEMLVLRTVVEGFARRGDTGLVVETVKFVESVDNIISDITKRVIKKEEDEENARIAAEMDRVYVTIEETVYPAEEEAVEAVASAAVAAEGIGSSEAPPLSDLMAICGQAEGLRVFKGRPGRRQSLCSSGTYVEEHIIEKALEFL
ncbi:hypothetical protein BC829DRAFT_408339 [Chytridium lagenaria]|nr:hypothetical protein BC829DRAFT_408339 [Chytridium lagenaria]